MAKPSGHPVGVRGVSRIGHVASSVFFPPQLEPLLSFFPFINCQHFIFYFSFISAPALAPFFHLFFNYFCGRCSVCVCFIYFLFGFFIGIKHACCRQRCRSLVVRLLFIFFLFYLYFYSAEIPLAQLGLGFGFGHHGISRAAQRV